MTVLPCTFLFVPADRPERFVKALGAGADRIIIDLEDAVTPQAKPAARQALGAAHLDWSRVVIRINDSNSSFWADDLSAVSAIPAASIMVPKTECAETLEAVRRAAQRDVEIIPQIETVAGLARVEELSEVSGVCRCAFGHLDFALDMGCATDWEALLMVRSELVFRSRLIGLQAPIDSVTADLTDEAALSCEADRARRLGYGGKLLIHPKQVETVRRAFEPSAEEIAWAEQVMAARADAGAVQVNGRMVDKPVIQAARTILDRSRTGEDR